MENVEKIITQKENFYAYLDAQKIERDLTKGQNDNEIKRNSLCYIKLDQYDTIVEEIEAVYLKRV